MIWLTYRFAWYLFGDRQTGLLAGLIVSCQPAMLISSPRSIPDILLTFFLVVSAYGFVRLLRESTADWWSIAFAYVGTGLAVETKGFPAVMFACYVFAVLLLFRHAIVLRHWKRHLIGLLFGSGVGLAWFALMYGWHGDVLLTQFLGDQVVERVNRNSWDIASDLPQVILVVALGFLPWWGSMREAFHQWRVSRRGTWIPPSPSFVMLGGWSLLFLLLASCVDRVNVRYQTPIVPLLSVLAAGLLAGLEAERLRFWFVRLGRIASVTLAIASLVAAGIGLATGDMARVGVVCALVICYWAVGFSVLMTRMSWSQLAVGVVLTLLCISPLTYVVSRSVKPQSLEERLLAKIESASPPNRSIAFLTKPAYPSRLRVVSGGELDASWISQDVSTIGGELASDDRDQDVLVLSHKNLALLDLAEFDVELIDNGFDHLRASEILSSVFHGELDEYLDQHRRHLAVAVRREREPRAPIHMATPTGGNLVR